MFADPTFTVACVLALIALVLHTIAMSSYRRRIKHWSERLDRAHRMLDESRAREGVWKGICKDALAILRESNDNLAALAAGKGKQQ
jgi:hypothetical protein